MERFQLGASQRDEYPGNRTNQVFINTFNSVLAAESLWIDHCRKQMGKRGMSELGYKEVEPRPVSGTRF
jgi:hypothetical protein